MFSAAGEDYFVAGFAVAVAVAVVESCCCCCRRCCGCCLIASHVRTDGMKPDGEAFDAAIFACAKAGFMPSSFLF